MTTTTNTFSLLFNTKQLIQPEYLPPEQPKNIYDTFIDFLKNRELDLTNLELKLEEHHIVPLHKSKRKRFSEEAKNEETIIVTYEEHFSAHFYHSLVYRLPGDFLFLQLRQNINADKAKLAQQLGGKIAGNLNTPAQQAQRRAHLKLNLQNLNPSKAGSVGSPKQKAHSSKIGKMYGQQAGISRQNPQTKARIQRPMQWIHESGVEVFLEKAKTVQEILEILNQHVPGSVTFSSGLSSILRKVEKNGMGGFWLKKLRKINRIFIRNFGSIFIFICIFVFLAFKTQKIQKYSKNKDKNFKNISKICSRFQYFFLKMFRD
jgi:hypothetical protein